MTRAQNELYLFGSENTSFLNYISQKETVTLSGKDNNFINNLKLEQAKFYERLKINQFMTCKTDGYHKEIIEIDDAQELERIDKYCWEKVDDYIQRGDKRPAKRIYEDNMKGKLGELGLKKYLGNLITPIDFSNRKYGDGGYDFSLKSESNIHSKLKHVIIMKLI